MDKTGKKIEDCACRETVQEYRQSKVERLKDRIEMDGEEK